MIIVSDTSALSNLALVDHLWLLEAIYQTEGHFEKFVKKRLELRLL
jgi:predicted nucleic acid-binding protein